MAGQGRPHRALILGDIHSNLEAFQAVLQDARGHGGFDEVWCLGDTVGYGPDPGPCIELLQALPHHTVAGNHDLAAIGAADLQWFNPHAAAAVRWTAGQLSPGHRSFLAGLPQRLERGPFTLVHGSPRDPIYEYVVSPEVAGACFGLFTTPYCLVGHSHLPFLCLEAGHGAQFLGFPEGQGVRLPEARLIINPGGVGQPRDGDPRASYVLFESAPGDIFHFRVPYDVAATQAKMRRHGLPEHLAARLSQGR
ncbi:MAG: metallophosphoesterase family protein [Chloroflexi bacterium]|nr:metallophosphoesterase family protein [Chloroflexota bacterium]